MNKANCPLVEETSSPSDSCPVSRCIHNEGGHCAFHRQRYEGDLALLCARRGAKDEDVLARVESIKLALLADAWVEEVCGANLLDLEPASVVESADPRQAAQFNSWNKTSFTFEQVATTILNFPKA